ASLISRAATSSGRLGERRASKRSSTALATLLTFCPPGPDERTKFSTISLSSMRRPPTFMGPSLVRDRRSSPRRRPLKPRSSSDGGALQGGGDPLVEAEPGPLGGADQRSMQQRLHTDDELAGIRLFRLLAALPAEGQVIVDGVGERLFQFGNRVPLKGDHVAEIEDFAMKQLGVFIVLDEGLVAFVVHRVHTVISASIKKRRADFTAPLSVSLRGCGRWNTARTPFNATLTREPLPSLNSAPHARNSASTSRQGILA